MGFIYPVIELLIRTTMTYLNEVVKMIESESNAENASAALSSIAQRASVYTPVQRRSQLSKVCMYAGDILPAASSAVRKQTYIVC